MSKLLSTILYRGNVFARLAEFLDRHVFKHKPIDETIREEKANARREIEQARSYIHSQAFVLHMAKSHLKALEDWENGIVDGDI